MQVLAPRQRSRLGFSWRLLPYAGLKTPVAELALGGLCSRNTRSYGGLKRCRWLSRTSLRPGPPVSVLPFRLRETRLASHRAAGFLVGLCYAPHGFPMSDESS